MTKPKLGFSSDSKQRAMRDLGFSLFEYSGKIADAPTQVRHLARDLKAGVYLTLLQERVIIKNLSENASGHKHVYMSEAELLGEAFKEAIYYAFQFDYVYIFKDTDNSLEVNGVLSEDKITKMLAVAEILDKKYKAGFYAMQFKGQDILFISEPYKVFENLLLDLAIYSPISPFKKYATQLTNSAYAELKFEYFKFGFSGDAAITLAGSNKQKLVATVVNYPEIDGVEKLLVKAPEMLQLLLDLQNSKDRDIMNLRDRAAILIGEIGS